MKDLKAYWKEVRQVEATLKTSHPTGVWLSSLQQDNGLPDGLVSQALPFVAAQCIVNKTHEFATEEQIKAHLERQATEARHIEARRRWAGNMPDVFVVHSGGSER